MVTDIVERLRQGIKASKLNDWDFERTEADMEEGADEIERLRAVVQSFADAMNILSSRPGITITEVANMLNEVGDAARAALEGK